MGDGGDGGVDKLQAVAGVTGGGLVGEAGGVHGLEEEVAAGGQPDLNPGRDSVLRTAKRFGKARFAQVTSKHVGSATSIPDYIRRALEWLMADAPNR